MTKLLLPPVQEGFAVDFGNEVVSTRLDGGLSRRRRDIIGASDIISVRWVLDPGGYEYLRNFFRGTTRSGSLPFQIDLNVDGLCIEKTAYFVEGSLNLDERNGRLSIVSALLEVEPEIVDEDYLAALAMLYEEYGTTDVDELTFLNPLETLVNTDLEAITA